MAASGALSPLCPHAAARRRHRLSSPCQKRSGRGQRREAGAGNGQKGAAPAHGGTGRAGKALEERSEQGESQLHISPRGGENKACKKEQKRAFIRKTGRRVGGGGRKENVLSVVSVAAGARGGAAARPRKRCRTVERGGCARGAALGGGAGAPGSKKAEGGKGSQERLARARVSFLLSGKHRWGEGEREKS